MPNNVIGERIRNIRIELGLSLNKFAATLDSNAKSGTVANWEKGRNLPNAKRLKRIAELGGITVAELLNETETFALVEENKRLREALETIAKMQLSDDYSDAYYNEQYFNIVKHARQALEGDQHEPSTD